jgi:hypothetical protein
MNQFALTEQMECLWQALARLAERRQQPFDQQQRAADAREAHQVLDQAFALARSHRGQPGPESLWHAAAKACHDAVAAAYLPGFWDSYDGLRACDSAGLEPAVAFLEADPWFFRSGYIKGYLIGYIKRVDLPPEFVPRLRRVVLAAVDGCDHREFRSYCRLARKVDAPELRAALVERLTSADPRTRRHARWVLDACEQRLQPRK